ncbi:ComEA family DNA-binding protein [Acidithiobacillus sp. IBUN Pt1247-S3]|uniref:ComEA family DNA-binding protein n=1 Tax=Acidithiobacillus sp. IBUN Pt1247-S3 TaxID=3166642 RepID=UPI0034E52287
MRRVGVALLLLLVTGAAWAGGKKPANCPEQIDINHADASTLRCLRGVGEKRADAIVAYRDAHGPFTGPMGVAAVLGEKIALRLRSRLQVGNSELP